MVTIAYDNGLKAKQHTMYTRKHQTKEKQDTVVSHNYSLTFKITCNHIRAKQLERGQPVTCTGVNHCLISFKTKANGSLSTSRPWATQFLTVSC